jgi:hypothetical protein
MVELNLRDRQIDTLIFTYSPEWEAQRLASMAAPIRAAREEQARQRTMPAPLATPLPLDEPAVATPPVAPQDTQGRTTPPLAPWVAGAFAATVMAAFGALSCPSWPRQGHQAKPQYVRYTAPSPRFAARCKWQSGHASRSSA